MSELSLEEYGEIADELAEGFGMSRAQAGQAAIAIRLLLTRTREAESLAQTRCKEAAEVAFKLVEAEGREAGLREVARKLTKYVTWKRFDDEKMFLEALTELDEALATPAPTRVAELVKHGCRVLTCLSEHGFEPGEDPRVSDFAQALAAFPQEQSDEHGHAD